MKSNTLMDRKIFYSILAAAIVLILNDFSKNINIGDTIAGIRIYLLPILVPYLMFKAGWLKNINKKRLLKTLFLITSLAIVFGIFQKNTFNGDVRSLWFFNFFQQYKENLVEVGPYNYIRNEVLRTTSFFVSPINFSIAVAISTTFVIELLFSKSKLFTTKILVLLLLFFCYGLFIAETRVGIFMVLLGVSIHVCNNITRINKNFITLLCIPLFAIFITFVSLIYGYTDDPSALGRLVQYGDFFEYFKLFGLGFNSENVLTRFDTYYMSLALAYGIFVVVPIYFYLDLVRLLNRSLEYMKKEEIFFAMTTFIISLVFIYSFAFQFTAGSYQFRMLFFLMFIVLANRPKYVIAPK